MSVLEPSPGDLPEPVRVRLVAIVAAALPEIVVLPVPLRRILDFAPSRRARAGAVPILAALEDPDFRRRAALAVPAGQGAGPQTGGDPAATAALAWLTRRDGWLEEVDEVRTRLADQHSPQRAGDTVARLTERLERAEQDLREVRATHRGQLDEVKTENARLRRALGDERRAKDQALGEVSSLAAASEESRVAAETVSGARERELRAALARLARQEAEEGAGRRTARAERDEATVRTRLLLDTILDAADGLRRELALPPASGSPADRVERGLASEGVREPSWSGQLGPTSSALLDQYLSMPRARLVVDGYNVTKSVWSALPLESQRIRLLNLLAPVGARTGAETTVVFDAHQAEGTRPVVSAPRGLRVVFSPGGVIADDVIRDLVGAEPTGRVVVVVTADAELAADVRRDGARVCAPAALLALMGS